MNWRCTLPLLLILLLPNSWAQEPVNTVPKTTDAQTSIEKKVIPKTKKKLGSKIKAGLKKLKPQRLTEAQAKNRYLLKAGPSLGVTNIRTISEHHTNGGAGLNTHAGYIWKYWEFNLSFYGIVAPFQGLYFEVDGGQLRAAKGEYRSISFGPTFKYMSKYVFFKNWRLFVQGGPLVAMQTFKVRSAQLENTSFTPGHKIAYEGPGATLSVGFDEINTLYHYKGYWEIAYRVLTPKKYSVVGGREIEAETLSTTYSRERAVEQSFYLNFGFYLF